MDERKGGDGGEEIGRKAESGTHSSLLSRCSSTSFATTSIWIGFRAFARPTGRSGCPCFEITRLIRHSP